MFTNVPEERYALIIGSVQSGKSTLLNTIAEHCGVELNTPVGTGDKSCTTGCAVYNFKTPSKSCAYKNVEESFVAHITDALTGGTTEPEPSGFSLSDFLDDEDFVAKIQEYPSMEFKIGLIDTPGLRFVMFLSFSTISDSRGLDEEIIHDIVSTIRRVGYLSSIILVFGKGTALSGALIEVINYYASLLSGFRCSILVVHTKWDPLADDYVTATKTRQENIDEILGAKGFHLIHYFVDLLIPPTSSRVRGRYREHCIALRCNRLNSIISNVYSSPLIDAQKLTIPKPRSMVLNDEAVRDSLELAGDAVRSTLQKLDSNLQDLVPQIEEAERCIAKYTTQLDTVNNRLNVVDTNQLVEVASVEVEESWGFFVERKKTVEVFSNTDVYDYKAVCDTPYTKWKRIKVEPRRVKGTAISPWFRGAYGRYSKQVGTPNQPD